jgi:hypothetical protein
MLTPPEELEAGPARAGSRGIPAEIGEAGGASASVTSSTVRATASTTVALAAGGPGLSLTMTAWLALGAATLAATAIAWLLLSSGLR